MISKQKAEQSTDLFDSWLGVLSLAYTTFQFKLFCLFSFFFSCPFFFFVGLPHVSVLSVKNAVQLDTITNTPTAL